MRKLFLFLFDFTIECYLLISYPIYVLFHNATIYRHVHPKGTIVLVSCWFNRNHYHDTWISYLEKKGFHTYYIFLPLLFDNFQTTVAKLDKQLSRLRLKNYTLVGISTGALVCLYYLTFYKKWHTIHKFISIGGPLHGTIAALGIAFTEKGRAMLPWSSFIKTIQKITVPPHKMITFSARFDELVPRKSTQMRGNTTYIINVWGHNRFHLDNKETYDLIAKIAGKV
jgi:pimeloyl-ACP methyl ester carboxylesterase